MEVNAAALCSLHGCEDHFGLQRLPELQFPNPPLTDLISKKPSFKNLDHGDILILRNWLHNSENTQQLNDWAEVLMRYLEINQSSLLKKALAQFQSVSIAHQSLLELSVFLLDFYFEGHDLRFLNIVLKMIDLLGIVSLKSITKDLREKGSKIPIALVQLRLLILSEAALQQLCCVKTS